MAARLQNPAVMGLFYMSAGLTINEGLHLLLEPIHILLQKLHAVEQTWFIDVRISNDCCMKLSRFYQL